MVECWVHLLLGYMLGPLSFGLHVGPIVFWVACWARCLLGCMSGQYYLSLLIFFFSVSPSLILLSNNLQLIKSFICVRNHLFYLLSSSVGDILDGDVHKYGSIVCYPLYTGNCYDNVHTAICLWITNHRRKVYHLIRGLTINVLY